MIFQYICCIIKYMDSSQQNCEICRLASRDIQITVKTLLLRMENLKYEVIRPLKDHGVQESFTKLINSLFRANPKIRPESFRCPHASLMQTFLEIIKCRPQNLNEASDFLMMEQIKRSYQLEVISNQVREVSLTLVKYQFQPGIEKSALYHGEEKLAIEEKKKNQVVYPFFQPSNQMEAFQSKKEKRSLNQAHVHQQLMQQSLYPNQNSQPFLPNQTFPSNQFPPNYFFYSNTYPYQYPPPPQ